MKWDIINRNLNNSFGDTNILARYAKRGPWNMVPLVDIENGCIYMLMREERLKELQKMKSKRRKNHYMDAFTKSFNIDLSDNKQMNLFNEVDDSVEIEKTVSTVLKSMEVDKTEIKRHAVILWEGYKSELVSVRCCILDPMLSIVEQEDWSEFIVHDESIIMENVTNDEGPKHVIQPMKLKVKAKQRIQQKEII